MTVTYPHDRPLPPESHVEPSSAEPFVPVYARTRNSTRSRKGGVKTWMILAPVGVLVLGGVAAAMVFGSGDDAATTPLVEPAATAPVLPAQPLPTEAAPVGATAPTIEATPTPAPVVRAAPARRAAPTAARRPTPAPAAATREATAEPAGPQPYTSTLNTSPTTAPAAPAPPPVIVIQPQS